MLSVKVPLERALKNKADQNEKHNENSSTVYFSLMQTMVSLLMQLKKLFALRSFALCTEWTFVVLSLNIRFIKQKI